MNHSLDVKYTVLFIVVIRIKDQNILAYLGKNLIKTNLTSNGISVGIGMTYEKEIVVSH
jgi:hypothetical protein